MKYVFYHIGIDGKKTYLCQIGVPKWWKPVLVWKCNPDPNEIIKFDTLGDAWTAIRMAYKDISNVDAEEWEEK